MATRAGELGEREQKKIEAAERSESGGS